MRVWLFFFILFLVFSSCERGINDSPVIQPVDIQNIDSLSQNRNGQNKPNQEIEPNSYLKFGKTPKKKFKNQSRKSNVAGLLNSNFAALPDTSRISRLNFIRSQNLKPDLQEPLNRTNLFSQTTAAPFVSMITLSQETILRVNFDNDILDYTDRFYTNGIRIELISPELAFNPANRLMIPYWNSGTNYYGLSLVQNMYTPSTTKLGGILYGDRPYAAYLYVGSFKITNDPVRHFRQTSELDAGIIGPNSYGEWVQRSFHNAVPTNNEPLGWEYQVKNDLVLNYNILYEKGFINARSLELTGFTNGCLGTLYTNFSGGIQLRTGWFNPYFANLGTSKRRILMQSGLRQFQLFFFLKGAGKVVGYDATLQGGLFNQSSVYTLPASEISRMVFQGSAGVSLSVNGLKLDVEQFVLSPEFQNGWWHKWVHIALSFSL